ncbi:hypothetical protein L218DRAFT_443708 [Marasmius fiardii PR-910]|nr:hypothetical protein L218DRAFT_443708 [Marasmius fiardii PR-910]
MAERSTRAIFNAILAALALALCGRFFLFSSLFDSGRIKGTTRSGGISHLKLPLCSEKDKSASASPRIWIAGPTLNYVTDSSFEPTQRREAAQVSLFRWDTGPVRG